MNTVLPSEDLFRIHFVGWKILGLIPTEKYPQLYAAYSIFMNIIITIGYPLHLMMGLLMSTSIYDILKNFTVNMTCVGLSVKIICCWLNFHNIQTIMEIIKSQNQRNSVAKDELDYNKNVLYKHVRLLLSVFVKFYATSWALCELSVLCNGLMGTWELMFPAYFPFDPFANTGLYILAHVYQFFGVSFQILQGVVMDTFSVMNLCILSGQIHTLNMKVSKLGRDEGKTLPENNEELVKCIEVHKELMRHIPKAKATAIADTPELKRIAENTKIQSNVKYHEDFEKAKGKFTQVADDPETLRIKQNTKIISNVAYHGDLEKKAAMEKQRGAAEASENLKDESEYFSEQLAAEQFAQYAPQVQTSHSPLPPQQLSPRLPLQQQQQQPQYNYTPQQQQAMLPPPIHHQPQNTAHIVPSNQAGTTQIYPQHNNNSRQQQQQQQLISQTHAHHQYATPIQQQQQQQFIQHEQQYQHYQQPQTLRQLTPQQQQLQQTQHQQQGMKQASHLYPSSTSTATNVQHHQQQQNQQAQQQQYQQPSNAYNQLRSAILQSSHHPTGGLQADSSQTSTPSSSTTPSSYSYDQYDNKNYSRSQATPQQASQQHQTHNQLYQQHHINNNINNATTQQNNNCAPMSTSSASSYTSPGPANPGINASATQQLFSNTNYNNYPSATNLQTPSSSSGQNSFASSGSGGGGGGVGVVSNSLNNGGVQPSSHHHHHHHHANSNGAVINGSIGKIADYDPLSDGPRNLPNPNRQSTTLIYSSDSRGNVNNSYPKRVGSVADIDPVNGIYGSLSAEQQLQQQQQQQHQLQQQQYYQQMPTVQQQQQQQQHQQQLHHNAHPKHNKQSLRVYRALYDYEAQDVDEVSFREGDIIFEVESIESGWMTGRVERTGKTGMLPANYVENAVI